VLRDALPDELRAQRGLAAGGAYSADGGRSWTPVELAMNYTGPLIIVAGIQTIQENGHPRYLLPAHATRSGAIRWGRATSSCCRARVLCSDWSLAGHIPQPAAGRSFLHEGGLAPVRRREGESSSW